MLGMVVAMTVVNWPTVVVLVPCLVIFLWIATIFRAAYPQVKRLENVTRSPVFDIVQETVDGLVTLRTEQEESVQ